MLLAFAVLSHHGPVTVQEILPGAVSVRLFFMISGFYMALVLDGKYGPGQVGTFYGNRVLRLFPGYLVVALVSLALLLVLDLHPFSSCRKVAEVVSHPWGAVVWAGSGLLILGQEALFLVGIGPGGVLGWAPGDVAAVKGFSLALVPQAWSVSLELCFYVLAPFLARLSSRVLVLLAVTSLGLYAGLWASGAAGAAVAYRLLPAQLYLFLGGMLSYRAWRLVRGAWWLRPAGLALVPGVPVALVAMGRAPGAWLFPVAAVLVWCALPALFAATRRSRWDRLLGHFSYPFYIVQFVMITLYEEYLGEADGLVLLAMVCVGAAVLWLAVDRPVDRWRQRRAGAAALVLPGAGGAGAGLLPVPAVLAR